MILVEELKVEDVVRRRTIIVGERGRGKTLLTARLLESLLRFYPPHEITVVDMAPTTLSPNSRLQWYTSTVRLVRYLAPPIVRAPRIEGRRREEVLELAEFNKRVLDPLLDEYLSKPTRALVVNDLTIYFHAGSSERVLECVHLAETFLANAYKGSSLAGLDKGSKVSEREARELFKFIKSASPVVIEV